MHHLEFQVVHFSYLVNSTCKIQRAYDLSRNMDTTVYFWDT